MLFGVIGGSLGWGLSIIMRIELSLPGFIICSSFSYNSCITFHGILMISFMIMPLLIGGFGNLLIPFLIGVSDLINSMIYTVYWVWWWITTNELCGVDKNPIMKYTVYWVKDYAIIELWIILRDYSIFFHWVYGIYCMFSIIVGGWCMCWLYELCGYSMCMV